MMCNNPILDLVNMKACLKFGEILSFASQDFGVSKGHSSGTNKQKMMCNNPKLDFVNMNAYIKFGENMSVGSQHIELKLNLVLN